MDESISLIAAVDQAEASTTTMLEKIGIDKGQSLVDEAIGATEYSCIRIILTYAFGRTCLNLPCENEPSVLKTIGEAMFEATEFVATRAVRQMDPSEVQHQFDETVEKISEPFIKALLLFGCAKLFLKISQDLKAEE